MKRWLSLATALVLLPAALPAGELPELPVEVRSAQGIRFYNGGVGIGERSKMPRLFPLTIVLATSRGLYLNDADVKVLDAKGKEILSVRADNGPWLVADLPPGTYRVEAVLEGRSAVAQSVKVKAGERRATILRWKESEIDMGL